MSMNILLLRHYPPVEGRSMRSFADEIAAGMRSRGHSVRELTAPMFLGRVLPPSHRAAKWLGYVDQFLIFPPYLWLRACLLPRGSLCVLSDQALGPWLPWLIHRAHVVHCHDLLALEASLGFQPFLRLSWSGRWYQKWILQGFRRGRCFLSVSRATQAVLERHLPQCPKFSGVLYNPLPRRFVVLPKEQAVATLRCCLPGMDRQPFLLHIGTVWYKNRYGVLNILEQLHQLGFPQHLVLVGPVDAMFRRWLYQHPQLSTWVHVLERAGDELVVALYNNASVLLFPSHAEGFGWPILEALACGCPVITTDRPPMTEVGGQAVATIPPAPPPPEPLVNWARKAAQKVLLVLARSDSEKARMRALGFAQARRFQLEPWLDQLESYYRQALVLQGNSTCVG